MRRVLSERVAALLEASLLVAVGHLDEVQQCMRDLYPEEAAQRVAEEEIRRLAGMMSLADALEVIS